MLNEERIHKNSAKKSQTKPPNAGKGRPKGCKNKTTRQAHEAIDYAFDKAGGQTRLAEWVNASDKNYETFITQLYAKRIPKNLDIKGEFTSDIGPRLLEARSRQLAIEQSRKELLEFDNQGKLIDKVIEGSVIEEIEEEEKESQ